MEAKILGSMFGGLAVLAAFTLLGAAHVVEINTQLEAIKHSQAPAASRGMRANTAADDALAAAEHPLIVTRGLSAGAVAILALGTILFSIMFALAAKKAHDAAPQMQARLGL